MFGLPLAFTAPWLLVSLVALPVLWILLRAVPPAPIRRRFPGVALLLGLQDDETVMDRTPWWLLLLRMLIIAFAIIGLAGPILNPQQATESNAPVLVLTDGSWAQARGWPSQLDQASRYLAEAERAGRSAAVLKVTGAAPLEVLPAGSWVRRLPQIAPDPWLPRAEDFRRIAELLDGQRFETFWLSDGLDRPGRQDLLDALQDLGPVSVVKPSQPVVGISAVKLEEGILKATVKRSAVAAFPDLTLAVRGRDPNGIDRTLTRGVLSFEPDALTAEISFSLPSELRSRISRFEIEGHAAAGAVFLTDDTIRRREVAIITTRDQREGLELLSPSHYLRQALVKTSDLIEGAIPVVLPANPDVVILPDVASLAPSEEAELLEWAESGGLLLRFAGPNMAASDLGRSEEHPLMPVRLRAGGRTVGGAMSWGEPKSLAPFTPDSPFYGLSVPEEVRVTAQVVAQPDPDLAERVLAELSDGTPLVTRKAIGDGQVVLFHVTANAEWSGLPLSGLFVQMLDRLAVLSAVGTDAAQTMEGTIWQPLRVLDSAGRLQDGQAMPGVDGAALLTDAVGPKLRPGLYRDKDKSFARNTLRADDDLVDFNWPSNVKLIGNADSQTRDLTSDFLVAALILLLVDTLVSLALSGRLHGLGLTTCLAFALTLPQDATAQSAPNQRYSDEVALGYVVTGNASLDELSRSGLLGLSNTLFARTSVEPAPPVGVNLETSELAFFPFLYWPISPDQPLPSDNAYGKLNQYLRSGGMILFDTRDADVAGLGAGSPNGRKLQELARPLDIPKLETVPKDHVLTRTFYLMQEFPGRYLGRNVWVEAAPPDAEMVEGMPFRNLNDGVTPVVIGGNDWAAAWAADARGVPIYPVGRGMSGERQREMAYRFGVNLIMYVLTGNYKSDQVHVPALLDRLGQ